MSKYIESQVWQSGLAGHLKPLAAVLADISDDGGGSLYPSVPYVAWLLGRSERAVQDGLAELRTLGVLIPVGRRKGGRGVSNEHVFVVERLPKREAWRRSKGARNDISEDQEPETEKGATKRIPQVQKPATVAPIQAEDADRTERVQPTTEKGATDDGERVQLADEKGATNSVAIEIRQDPSSRSVRTLGARPRARGARAGEVVDAAGYEAELEKLAAEFGPKLGIENARRRVQECLNSTKYRFAQDKLLCVRLWLEEAVARAQRVLDDDAARRPGRGSYGARAAAGPSWSIDDDGLFVPAGGGFDRSRFAE